MIAQDEESRQDPPQGTSQNGVTAIANVVKQEAKLCLQTTTVGATTGSPERVHIPPEVPPADTHILQNPLDGGEKTAAPQYQS